MSTGVATWTVSYGTPRAAAAICAATVNAPCPSSCPPTPTLTEASSVSSTQALEPAFGGMAGAFHISAIPFPRRLFGPLGGVFFPIRSPPRPFRCIASIPLGASCRPSRVCFPPSSSSICGTRPRPFRSATQVRQYIAPSPRASRASQNRASDHPRDDSCTRSSCRL